MKALTLTQPWATLVAIGAKRIETRSWQTTYRGPLAIHAAKGFPKWAKDICGEVPFFKVLADAGMNLAYTGTDVLPFGSVVATCELIDCLPMESTGCLSGVFEDYPELNTGNERWFGDFTPGRWAWVLDKVQPLINPVKAKGALSLWEWNA